MNQVLIQNATGKRQVQAYQNDEESPWHARLYVNRGETATTVAKTFKTLASVKRWAAKVMGQ